MGASPARSSALQRLMDVACEDLARLVQVLSDTRCLPWLRCSGEVVHLGKDERHATSGCSESRTLEVPITDSDQKTLATLCLSFQTPDVPEALQQLLLKLARSTARSIAERLFRLRYCEYWVIAGASLETQDRTVLLAVDAHRNIVGVATQTPGSATPGAEGGLSSLVRLMPIDIASVASRHHDTLLTLRWPYHGELWSLLVTPPSVGGIGEFPDRGALSHCRPRVDSLGTPRLMSARAGGGGLPSRLVERIQEYVDTHLESPLRIEELAATLSMSRSHFARSLRAAVGMTPHDYVMQRRLRRAQQLLVHSEQRLVDIALATGFSDQSHFSRRFHQVVGVPPSSFRRHRGVQAHP